MERHRINYAASRSRRERRGAPWGAAAAPAAACSTPSCLEWAGLLNLLRDKVKIQTDIRLAESRGSFAEMQGLSSRAHAFSVEALVGKPCKRMKVSEGHESSSAGDTGSETSIFTGEAEGLLENTFNIYAFYAQDGTIQYIIWSAVCKLFNLIRPLFHQVMTFPQVQLSFYFIIRKRQWSNKIIFEGRKKFCKYSPCQLSNWSNFLFLSLTLYISNIYSLFKSKS